MLFDYMGAVAAPALYLVVVVVVVVGQLEQHNNIEKAAICEIVMSKDSILK